MNKKIRKIACLTAVLSMASAAFSCSSNSVSGDSSASGQTTSAAAPDSPVTTAQQADTAGDAMDIVWLSDYDLNPQEKAERSVALALFEDQYKGSVKYIYADPEKKYSKLDSLIASGAEVDMFPYEANSLPEGILKKNFAPLDPYYEAMGMNISGLWDDIKGVADTFKYDGQHYVVPYSLSDPIVITYSRKLMEEEGLDDPYKLYQEGKWDWKAFTEMMDKFVENADGRKRYGICGDFGKAAIQSTGHTVINYDGSKLSNNITDPEIAKAEALIDDIAKKDLYRSEWRDCFPSDQSTLFYAMGSWTLGNSNAINAERDLMVVPFPKETGAKDYYLPCTFNAKMLVSGSEKGNAVATYIMCERYAATDKKMKDAAKQQALVQKKAADGTVQSFITEEQYNALQSYLDPKNVVPAFDFGYGMGEKMYSNGSYSFETRGVMNNLERALLENRDKADSWEALRDQLKGTVDEEVSRFNK